jgi:hypothetical protein
LPTDPGVKDARLKPGMTLGTVGDWCRPTEILDFASRLRDFQRCFAVLVCNGPFRGESTMRALIAIGAAFVMACLVPAAARADAPGPTAAPAKPGCKCPPVRAHRHVRHYRHASKRVIAAGPPLVAPVYYNTGIPSPWDPAYDRAMTLHFRSPFVSAIVDPEPGYPHTPPVRAVAWYRFASGPTVYQYDGITGQYIALSQYDAHRVYPHVIAVGPPAPPALQ